MSSIDVYPNIAITNDVPSQLTDELPPCCNSGESSEDDGEGTADMEGEEGCDVSSRGARWRLEFLASAVAIIKL